MITLSKMTDMTGTVWEPGTVIKVLDSGVRISSVRENDSSVLVWIPEEYRPLKYELRKMVREIISGSRMEKYLLWPEKIIYEDSTGQVCGYTAKKPAVCGQLTPLKEFISRKKNFDSRERRLCAEIGYKTACIYEAVRNTAGRYTMGICTPDSFYTDEKFNVFYLEAYNCARERCPVVKTCYAAPELLMQNSWAGKFSEETDAFNYALILFQILTGRFPYDPGRDADRADMDHVWKLMCDGESIFYDETSVIFQQTDTLLKSYSGNVETMFRRTFDYCGARDYTQMRPTIGMWMETLLECTGS